MRERALPLVLLLALAAATAFGAPVAGGGATGLTAAMIAAPAAFAATIGVPPAALAAPAPPDSSLQQFLGQLSDSTDRYFGVSAAPVDTAGLDTVLSDQGSAPHRLELSPMPSFAFNRADGPTYGGSLKLEFPSAGERRNAPGALTGRLAYPVGSDRALGGAGYRNRLWLGRAALDVELFAGRVTAGMDRDHRVGFLDAMGALLAGADGTHYLRRDGFEGALAHDHAGWRLRAGWRDMLESPLTTTTTWNLFRREPDPRWNVPAVTGRTRELSLEAGLRWPRLPLRSEIGWTVSSPELGSAFDFHRLRVATGADLTLGRVASLVPQVGYGRLGGTMVPQAAFYLGGAPTLRSLRRAALGGSGLAIARVDLIGAGDLLADLRIPHPAALPLQGALFAASGAVWGADPYAGPTPPRPVGIPGGDGWPDRRDWLSEAGVSLIYSSAIIDEGSMVRFNYAWPIGPHRGGARFSLAFSRGLDLLKR